MYGSCVLLTSDTQVLLHWQRADLGRFKLTRGLRVWLGSLAGYADHNCCFIHKCRSASDYHNCQLIKTLCVEATAGPAIAGAGSSSQVDAACRLLIETHTRPITYSPLCNAPSSTYTGVSFSVAGSRHLQSACKATEATDGTILGYIPLVSHWIHPLCCTCICIVSKDHEKITSDVEGTGAGAAKGRPGAGSTHQASMATYGHTACISLLI